MRTASLHSARKVCTRRRGGSISTFSPSEIAEHLRQADETVHQKEGLIAILQAEERKLAAEADKLYDLYLAGEIPKEGFGRRYQPLEDRCKQIEEELPRLQAELDLLKIHQLSSEEILTEARALYSRWPTLPLEERRRIVEAITERITIGGNEVDINLLYLPPFLNADIKATPPHGFIAATSCTRAG